MGKYHIIIAIDSAQTTPWTICYYKYLIACLPNSNRTKKKDHLRIASSVGTTVICEIAQEFFHYFIILSYISHSEAKTRNNYVSLGG